MISLRCIIIATVVLLGHRGVLVAASEVGEGPRISEVRCGLDGQYKLGHWMPVRLTVSGGDSGFSGHVELSLIDGDNVTACFAPASRQPLKIRGGELWTGWRYAKAGRLGGAIRVTLRDEEGTVVAVRTRSGLAPHASTRQWVVTVGTDVGVEDAAVFLARMRAGEVVSTILTDTAEFPDRWFGYEGVNVIVVPTGTTSLLETMSDRQYAALLRWLRLGGRLILSAGRRAEVLFAPEHRFHALRPGEFVEMDTYWKASGLENFAHAAKRMQIDEGARIPVFSELRGRTLCFEGAGGTNDRAMVVRYPVSFGDITYVALDLELPPLKDWPERPRLLARLLHGRSEREESTFGDEQGGGKVTHLGFEDLSGQLRAALDQFPGVTLVQFSWIAMLIVFYIVLVGPIDFFGLRRLGRLQWTWVTFPVAVLLFCGVAIWLSQRWKGSRMQLNQVDIVDIDLASQVVRGTTWANIYSPGSAILGVTAAARPSWPVPASSGTGEEQSEVLVSWQGLPGTGLGGMNTPATVGMLTDSYRIYYPLARSSSRATGSGRLEGLRINPASTKGVLVRWSAPADLDREGRLWTDEFDLLQGEITNPLQVELSRCAVYYQNWAYPLERSLGPGASVRLKNAQPLDLRWLLTGRRVEGTAESHLPWQGDDLSDIDRILNMFMFHGAAGGHVYTGLSHSYQAFVDLSRHLRNGRAILIGRCQTPASRLTAKQTTGRTDAIKVTKDAEQHWTYYRVVLPVGSAKQQGAE